MTSTTLAEKLGVKSLRHRGKFVGKSRPIQFVGFTVEHNAPQVLLNMGAVWTVKDRQGWSGYKV